MRATDMELGYNELGRDRVPEETSAHVLPVMKP